ncbi:MAG: L,D-transpeptidase/peptidoglycan binding protein [Actinomycetota bacterium]|nr:L,D-transpeptidase/peptidoglycan binding protein [Actinomycetota bacterium]
MRSRQHARRRARAGGSARVAVSLMLGLGLLLGGAGYAAYRYDAASTNRLMPGVTIDGVELGEMSRDEAIAELTARAESRLDQQIEVVAGDQSWTVSAAELGSSAVIEPVVDRALAADDGYSWPERVFRRVMNRSAGISEDLRLRPDRTEITDFVEGVAGEVNVDPTNAQVDFVNDELVLKRPEMGWELSVREAVRDLRKGLATGQTSVSLPMERLEPKVGKDELGYTIVVDISDLELSLYDGLKLDRTYPVAAGSPTYPTPQGEWTVINKRENPTWTNPAPDGWGKSLPPVIGPGPTNPLGTRALDLNAPGIRIHGTSASYSIGSYASHGCVRMHMPDVEELFEIVPIGTTVHIVP